jgi:hypothetical protein
MQGKAQIVNFLNITKMMLKMMMLKMLQARKSMKIVKTPILREKMMKIKKRVLIK